MPNFIENLNDTIVGGDLNRSVTENGALGYKTTGKKLVDLNYMLSSMRNMEEKEIWSRFLDAYAENPTLAILWLFFARDIRGGSAERRTFRVIFNRLCFENPSVACRLIKLIPEYGRWDDVVEVFCSEAPKKVRDEAFRVIYGQWINDLDNARARKPISLLAKWLCSENSSSKETKRKAKMIREAMGYTPKVYRKTLSRLRQYLDVTERKMSANKWQDINYQAVPSRAAMNYRKAFLNHDEERYAKYLEAVKSGGAKIHSGTLFPHDIVRAYHEGYGWGVKPLDETLEAQWNALPNTVPPDKGTLVVVDGSGSMYSSVGYSLVTCEDVAQALGIYFAERLTGEFKDYFITFSSRPQLVHLSPDLTLNGKMNLLSEYDDCSNTNIEATFDLILDTAVRKHLRQEELPANVLIITDGEFDAMTCQGSWKHERYANATLFEGIAAKFADKGYKLPRLVFWNVCSRTGTIPVRENDFGVALVSGFSPSIADMVMSGKLDPFECLVDKLMSDRYQPVLEAVKS